MTEQQENSSRGFSSKAFSKIETLLNSNIRGVSGSTIIVFVMIFVYFLVFSIFTVLRQITFKTCAFDLGIYDQALYTTLFEGKFFYETPDLYYTLSGSFFGVHFTPNTFVLLPFYYVFPRPETLLVFQSATIALAAVPIYCLARVLTQRKAIGIGFVALYLFNPFIHSLNTYDFHIESLLPLLSLSALYYFETKKWTRFVAFSILTGTTIDVAAFIVFFMGFYGLIRYPKSLFYLIRRKKIEKEKYKAIIASLIVLISAVFLLIVAIKIITLFGPLPLSSSGVGMFSKLGGNYIEIVANAMFQPWRLIDSFLYDGIYKLAYLSSFFLSVSFLAGYSPKELILCIPWIGVTLLTTVNTLYQPGYQFGAFIIPFIFYASTHGIRNIQRYTKDKLLVYRKMKHAFAILFAMVFFVSPLSPVCYYFSRSAAFSGYPIPTRHTMLLTEAVGLIPKNASVLAQNHIFPHVSSRMTAYVWVPLNVTVDYAIADSIQHDYFSAHAKNESFKQQFEALKNSGEYQVIFDEDNITVIKRLST